MQMIKTGVRVIRAVGTNILAGMAPGVYVRLTGDTGRGDHGSDLPEDVAVYLRECFEDYLAALAVRPEDGEAMLRRKTILEYGPGDILGVALLLVAYGAEKVYCVDRFPLVRHSAKNVQVMALLLETLQGERRARADSCFNVAGDPTSGFAPSRIEYLVRRNGCSGLVETADLIISRAVLEHVDDLDATFADMAAALVPDGESVHLVDLRSHGFHRESRLDFLVWPSWLWRLMYSHKGIPNRWRVDKYRELLARHGFDVLKLEAIELASADEVSMVRGRLARPFRDLDPDDISWLGFWLVCRKRAAAAARGRA